MSAPLEILKKRAEAREPAPPPPARGRAGAAPGGPADMLGKVAQSAARAAGTQLGRAIMRGILGSMFGGRARL